MQHGAMCHMVIHHAVMGYVTEKSLAKKHTSTLLQPTQYQYASAVPPALPASSYRICPYHVLTLTHTE